MPCHYDCTEDRTLADIPEYSDISGIGVIIGYTVTAGITVLIITGYYFVAHNPEVDPFRKENEQEQPSKPHTPHPVDQLMLRCVRGLWRRLFKRDPPAAAATVQPKGKKGRIEKALLKCVLTLSDLQILTGLSILISGYAQLHCGITVYHWQILVYLTWFCSLTHLSCLTFLRNHLYNHPGERLWRLAGMGILVVMLIVALLPTGNYNFETDPANYAKCSFKQLGPVQQDGEATYLGRGYYQQGGLDYASMIISVLLIGLGFVSRVVRLHRSLAIGVIAGVRGYFRERVRGWLRKEYEKCKKAPASPPHTTFISRVRLTLRSSRLKILLFYRPLLAVYLAVHAILDIWSSLILEVWWLLVSFAWGVYNLVLSMNGYKKKAPESKDWTFGQIAPVILLLAPTLSVIELLLESPSSHETTVIVNEPAEQPPNPPRVETMEIANAMNTSPPDGIHDDPDHDFYQDAWFQQFIIYLFLAVVFLSTAILFIPINPLQSGNLSKGQHLNYLIPSANILSWVPMAFVLGAINFILHSLITGKTTLQLYTTLTLTWGASFGFYIVANLFFETLYIAGFGVSIGVYIVFCFILAHKAQLESQTTS